VDTQEWRAVQPRFNQHKSVFHLIADDVPHPWYDTIGKVMARDNSVIYDATKVTDGTHVLNRDGSEILTAHEIQGWDVHGDDLLVVTKGGYAYPDDRSQEGRYWISDVHFNGQVRTSQQGIELAGFIGAVPFVSNTPQPATNWHTLMRVTEDAGLEPLMSFQGEIQHVASLNGQPCIAALTGRYVGNGYRDVTFELSYQGKIIFMVNPVPTSIYVNPSFYAGSCAVAYAMDHVVLMAPSMEKWHFDKAPYVNISQGHVICIGQEHHGPRNYIRVNWDTHQGPEIERAVSIVRWHQGMPYYLATTREDGRKVVYGDHITQISTIAEFEKATHAGRDPLDRGVSLTDRP